ncbi:MAG: SMP-30/gluconolactonase/LRE family protein [Candidatus Krumholzibacteriota bacterium]|nr:SMP-30/gluconolactonase/LRE family protein [Candidatus Krumholzibacteriota bacterium]
MRFRSRSSAIFPLMLLLSIVLISESVAQGEDTVPFDESNWNFVNIVRGSYLGRECVSGFAILKDVEFEDGVIEVDVAMPGGRSYPGIVFHVEGQNNYEHFYIRPHREGLYGDDLQYAPVTNGISSWQLYSGNGFSSSYDVPSGKWIHVRLEVSGTRASVFIDRSEKPDLVIEKLQHGQVKGAIGIQGPVDGSAYFSAFSYKKAVDLDPDPPREFDRAPGFIDKWELSKVFKISEVDIDERFDESQITEGDMGWIDVKADETGLVDIARYYSRTGREADLVFAKAHIHSTGGERKELKFGYSDYIGIFLNGDLLFTGNSAYRQRDPSFLGIVGLNDAVLLSLKKGENELVLMIAEAFGGWGFICQDAEAEFRAKGMDEKWKTSRGLKTPESVVYDRKRDILYVSNFDAVNNRNPRVTQFISRMGLDGRLIDLRWVEGLLNPTGMALYKDDLYVVERAGVARIDPERGEVIERYPFENGSFLNDIAIDLSGTIYISDSGGDVIYRYRDDKWERWLEGGEITSPNSLHIDHGRLFFGNSGDDYLKAADLRTGEIRKIADMGPGLIDGIKSLETGELIVSHWEGKLYRIDRNGKISKILDVRARGEKIADFDLVPGRGIVVIPTYYGNSVRAFDLGE